ncbi:MAG: hypothetical protein HY985_12565 [Magnetospirillum sp.]|nr:hypothetical protein [Magnetospirillum sp.]
MKTILARRRSATKPPFIFGRTNAIRVFNRLMECSPQRLWYAFRLKAKKEKVFRLLRNLSISSQQFEGPVLIDCSFNVVGFFARLAMFRSALGLTNSNEIAVVRNVEANIWSAKSLGIADVRALPDFTKYGKEAEGRARAFMDGVQSTADFLSKKLPYEMPVDVILYDGVLKLTKKHTVDVTSKETFQCVAMAFETFDYVEKLLKESSPSLVVVSHAAHFYYASLCFIAMKMGIPVVLATSLYGMSKFVKIRQPEDLYNYVDRPTPEQFGRVDTNLQEKMESAAWNYLSHRFTGKTNDIGGIYAYAKRNEVVGRQEICERFNWDVGKPIQIIYMANWFDFPHTYGMSQFEDIYDYALATLATIEEATHTNWLLKAHPCEDWYKGCLLEDMINTDHLPHVGIVDKAWDSVSVLKAVDTVVTIHGTIGIEAPALNKPTMVGDVGWYHDYGFVHYPKTREEYLRCLKTEWWREVDIEHSRKQALRFACFHFCRPVWEKGLDIGDDTLLDALYDILPGALSHRDLVQREVENMREWFYSEARCFHTFKILKADDFIVSNVTS